MRSVRLLACARNRGVAEENFNDGRFKAVASYRQHTHGRWVWVRTVAWYIVVGQFSDRSFCNCPVGRVCCGNAALYFSHGIAKWTVSKAVAIGQCCFGTVCLICSSGIDSVLQAMNVFAVGGLRWPFSLSVYDGTWINYYRAATLVSTSTTFSMQANG